MSKIDFKSYKDYPWVMELNSLIENDKIHTDSDLIDFARSNHVATSDVRKYIWDCETVGTPCEGCKHVAFRYDMSPCSRCSRQLLLDRYEDA